MNDMIICIGRQYGSGGREIGEKLAARLGVTCYDKLLLKQAAKEGGVSLGEVERQDEKPVSASAFLSGNVFADSASIGGAFYSQSQLVYDAEKEAILDAADKGGCVIIGRCASSLLRDRKNVLSVFIYADEADRVARIASRNRLDEPQARARMRKTDRMRRRYFDFYADTQWGDPESYDVMLSSSYYGVDGCVEMTISACQAPTAAEVPACRTCMTAPATPFTDIMEEDPFMPTTRSEAPFTPST